jgi:hypothetical protein
MSDEGSAPTLEAVLRSLAAETVRSAKLVEDLGNHRRLLAEMNKAYLGLRERKNAEIGELEAALAASDARAAGLERSLAEAEAVIMLAQHELGIEHPVWTTLDGCDGSMDACRELKALCDAGVIGFRFEITRAGKL